MTTPHGSVTNTPLPLTESSSFNDSTQQQPPPQASAVPATSSASPSASFGLPSSNNYLNNTPLSSIPPAIFDIVPALHQLLSRLLPATPPPLSSSIGGPPDHQSHSYTGATPLDIPGLTPATSGLMVKLQRARATIRALPDIDRTVDEQTMEIEFLKERVEKLEGLLSDIKEECRAKDQGQMGEKMMED